ncbi:MAG: ribonucleoside triphosphate reductase [Anaerolineales bacterium]|nr:ribonucleoside triphosphate reductase [Anaerolineales bacterium]
MSTEYVLKRDGTRVPFDRSRIENAIFAAARAVGNGEGRPWAETLTWAVLGLLEERFASKGRFPQVEEIQDVVEEVLVKSGNPRVAKAYILYRERRAAARSTRQMMLDSEKLVDDYLKLLDWRVSENSNMNYSLQGLNFYLASSIAAKYWLHKIYPPEVQDAHIDGAIHLHDLGMLSVYCCGWDLQDLILRGFGGVSGKIESAPPRHFRTALGQLVNFFYTLQGEAAGAVAVSSFDTLLAPFIAYDHLSEEEIRQALQEFMFNINVPTRVGFQTPFTNITMDLVPPAALRDQPVVIGGEPQERSYGDFQAEMDTLNRIFAEVMLSGDASDRVFTFPIPTYNITRDFDWESDKLEAVWAMTARYGIPYFANFINSDMDPDDARSMCCRLRLDNRELRRRMGGLFAAAPLTGSVGVVTINLPRLGYQASDEGDFHYRLERLMAVGKTSLEIKRKTLEQFTSQGLYPYSQHYLDSVYARTGAYWSNHFSTIGLIGMNEACLNLLGVGIDHPEGKAFTIRTLNFMRDVLAGFQEETGHFYNLEATPAEGATYRLAKTDKKQFEDIITAGTEDTPFYTNSTQLPVGYTEDIFGAADHQDDIQPLYTGGTVLHTFLGEQLDDWRQARRLVRLLSENYHLPYFTLTPTFSVCPVHGYLSGEQHTCSQTHSEDELERFGAAVEGSDEERKIPCEVYSRVVGYLRPVNQWNAGKQEEFRQRVTYELPSTAHAS